jgi:hypothetical protein
MHRVREGEPGFENRAEGVKPKYAVPLMITDQRERANSQNEKGPGSGPGNHDRWGPVRDTWRSAVRRPARDRQNGFGLRRRIIDRKPEK